MNCVSFSLLEEVYLKWLEGEKSVRSRILRRQAWKIQARAFVSGSAWHVKTIAHRGVCALRAHVMARAWLSSFGIFNFVGVVWAFSWLGKNWTDSISSLSSLLGGLRAADF